MLFPLEELFGNFNLFGSAVVVFDGEGRMIQVNSAGRSLFGVTLEKEIEGLSLASLFPDHLKAKYLIQLKMFASKSSKRRTDDQFLLMKGLKKDGGEFLVEVDVSKYKFKEEFIYCAVFKEFSEVGLAPGFVGNSFEEIYTFDANSYCFSWVDEEACQHLGYDMQELTAMTPLDLMPELSRVQFEELLIPLNLGTESEVIFQTVLKCKNWSICPVEVRLQLVNTESAVEFAMAVQDTSRPNGQSQGQGDTVDLISKIGCDLRSPMNTILGFCQLLESDTTSPLSEIQNIRLKEISKAGNQLLKVVNEFLGFVGEDKFHFPFSSAALEVQPIMEEALSRVALMTKREDVRIQCNLESLSGVRVQGDPTWLRQIFFFLLSNAVKFSQFNGSVWFECIPEGNQLKFEISNYALEMSSEPQKDSFDSSHPQVLKTAGLDSEMEGFSILKPLLEMMEGSIRVESIAGKGNLFAIALPKGAMRRSRLRPPSELSTHFDK